MTRRIVTIREFLKLGLGPRRIGRKVCGRERRVARRRRRGARVRRVVRWRRRDASERRAVDERERDGEGSRGQVKARDTT